MYNTLSQVFIYPNLSQVVSPLDFNIDDAIGNILTEFGIDEGDFGIEHNETNTSLSRNSTQEEILNIHKIFISGKNIENKIFEYDNNGNISFLWLHLTWLMELITFHLL